MNLLAEVDWPAVLARLADQHRRTGTLSAAAAGAAGPEGFDVHRLAAGLVVRAERWHLDAALAAAGLTDDADVALVARWLTDAATAYLRITNEDTDVPPPPAGPRPVAGLEVDAALAGLPLLDLAADLAAELGGLRVLAGPAGAGNTALWRPDARVILVDLDRLGGADLAHVFAHELGHALDPRLGQVEPAAEEAFADDAARVLLEVRPTTVAAARRLLEPYDRARPAPVLDDRLARPGLPSLFTFAALPFAVAAATGPPRPPWEGQSRPAGQRGAGPSTPRHGAKDGRPVAPSRARAVRLAAGRLARAVAATTGALW